MVRLTRLFFARFGDERESGQARFFFRSVGGCSLRTEALHHGPLAQVLSNHGGNFAVSFIVYFLAAIAASRLGWGRFAAAGSALLVVETFEVTNGFGVMLNVYAPVDLVANAVGVGVALAVDLTSQRHVATRAVG